MRIEPHHDEAGAVSVLFAVCVVVLFGAVALVIDGGQIWSGKRQLITAVDAGALAAAQEFGMGGNGCTAVASSYVLSNDDEAESITCTQSGASVTVSASVIVTHQLASMLGRDSTVVNASTTASFGPVSSLDGARPLGLCNGSDGFLAWQASGHSTTEVFRITYGKDNVSACGGENSPGNWGLLDFNGGANSNSETQDWFSDGYVGAVSAATWYEGDPGAFSNSMGVEDLVGETVFFPVFDDASGSGSNAVFHVAGFVGALVVDVKSTGRAADRYIDLRFVTMVADGDCCGDGAIDGGVIAIGLCRVDDQGECP
ncbi:MAG: pilus assembly protein TadG-related protein [Acidimicrobiales bacterium]|jgi:hypothetical protein